MTCQVFPAARELYLSVLQESTTSFGEVDCVAKVLPRPLSEMGAFTRSFFSEFGGTRELHTGADFHATSSLARPELANDTVLTGRTAPYTKGPAILHMLGSYMDATLRKVSAWNYACGSWGPSSANSCCKCISCASSMHAPAL